MYKMASNFMESTHLTVRPDRMSIVKVVWSSPYPILITCLDQILSTNGPIWVTLYQHCIYIDVQFYQNESKQAIKNNKNKTFLTLFFTRILNELKRSFKESKSPNLLNFTSIRTQINLFPDCSGYNAIIQ